MAYNLEIERKYLCFGDKVPLDKAISMNHCVQFYLLTSCLDFNSAPSEIRVVIRNDEKAEITIKSTDDEEIRDEFSFKISVEEAHKLEKFKMGNIIYKDRYFIPLALEDCPPLEGKAFWEVDVYKGQELGLVVAEVEIPEDVHDKHMDADGFSLIDLVLPPWIEKEVTGCCRLKNSQIARNSYMARKHALEELRTFVKDNENGTSNS